MCLHATITTKYPPQIDYTVAIILFSSLAVKSPFLLLQSHGRKVQLLFLSKVGVLVEVVSYWKLGLTMSFGPWFCGLSVWNLPWCPGSCWPKQWQRKDHSVSLSYQTEHVLLKSWNHQREMIFQLHQKFELDHWLRYFRRERGYAVLFWEEEEVVCHCLASPTNCLPHHYYCMLKWWR